MAGVAATSLTAGGFSGIGWKSPCASFINGSSAANAEIEPTTASRVASVAVNVRMRPSCEQAQLSIPVGCCLEYGGKCRDGLSGGFEVSGSGGEVNDRVGRLGGQRRPAVDLAHGDLSGGEQGPEQHGGGLR